jgi:hypothetical protein
MKEHAKAKYQYTVNPVHFTQRGDEVVVVARYVGNFPGSPIELTHTFVIADRKIRSLEIRG